MADIRRDAQNTWFQKQNHIKLARDEYNREVIFDSAVQRATSLGKTISGGTAGVISIQAAKPSLEVGPMPVVLTVDVSGSDFDAKAAPAAAEDFDNRVHDLSYEWDLGANMSGNFANTSGLPFDEWKDKRYWYGHTCKPVLPAGTHTIGVTVRGMVGGMPASYTDSIEVVVATPEATYPDAARFIYASDSDYTGAPSHGVGQEYNDFDACVAAATAYSGSAIVWMKAGSDETLTGRVELGVGGSNNSTNIHFDKWGAGANPIIRADDATDPASSWLIYFDQAYSSSVVRDVRFANIGFVGPFDAADWSGDQLRAMIVLSMAKLCVYQCSFTGINGPRLDGNNGTEASAPWLHVWDCDFGNWPSYPIFTSTNFGATTKPEVSILGTRNAQNVDALAFPPTPGAQSGSPVRINECSSLHIAKNDLFSNTGHYNSYAAQAVLKFNEDLSHHGSDGVISHNLLEGGLYSLRCNASGAEAYTQNFLIHGNACIGYTRTFEFVFAYALGFTIANNLFLMPNNEKAGGGNLGRFLTFNRKNAAPENTAVPMRVYGNTFVNDRMSANNGAVTPDLIRWYNTTAASTTTATTGSVEENNTFVQDRYGTDDGITNLDTATKLMTPRYKGEREPSTGTLDTAFATPDTIYTHSPLSGSSAIDAVASGLIGYEDAKRAVRPDPAALGWLELVSVPPQFSGTIPNFSYENDVAAINTPLASYWGSPTTGGTYSLNNVPAGRENGLYIDSSTGVFTIEPVPLPEGSWNISATYTDAFGSDTSNTFTVDVTAPAATAPAQFGSGDWSLSNPNTDGDLTVTISTLPDDGGATLTQLRYDVDSAGDNLLTASPATSNFTISGLTNDTAVDIRIWAVNSVGAGTPSAIKSATPTAPGAGTPDPLTYDGLFPASLAPADLPYDVHQHFTGEGSATSSVTAGSLPSGVTLTSGLLEDAGTFTGTASATISVDNGSGSPIALAAEFDAGGGGSGIGTMQVGSTFTVA